MKFSAVVLSHLSVNHLKNTLKSVSFADEIIIIQDIKKTGLKNKGKIKIYFRNLNDDFAAQRNFALAKAANPWVLFIDSDEIVSPNLALEIKKAIEQNIYQGFLLRRQNIIHGQALKHGETGSIKLLRLAKKSAGKFSRPVHEKWQIKGMVGELKEPLWHIKDNFTADFIDRISRYGVIDSLVLSQENKHFSLFRLFLNPAGKFIYNYIVRLGILDSTLGVFHAYLMSVQSLSVRVFQWQNKKKVISAKL